MSKEPKFTVEELNLLESIFENDKNIGRRNLSKECSKQGFSISPYKCRIWLNNRRGMWNTLKLNKRQESSKKQELGTSTDYDRKTITVLDKIVDRYSLAELRQLAKGKMETKHKPYNFSFDGEEVTVGCITDTHFGSKATNPQLVLDAFEVFKREEIDFLVHAGDVVEGFGRRAGQEFELSHLGYDAQKEHAVDILSQWKDCPFPIIMGNHDNFVGNLAGANIVKDICSHVPTAMYLGDNEGDFSINDVKIKLWHGNDGSTRTHSYRTQKVIESLEISDRPDVLVLGHTHKMNYFYDKEIHAVTAGCFQTQTRWMRNKALQAQAGFVIMKMIINETGIVRFTPQFYPFYK